MLTAAEADEELLPDEPSDGAGHVLKLGGRTGGAFAVEGTLEEIEALAGSIASAVRSARESLNGGAAGPAGRVRQQRSSRKGRPAR